MRNMIGHKFLNQKGAAIVEYAIILGLLLVAFLVFGRLLKQNSDTRRDRSMETVQQAAPCGQGSRLSGDQCL